ncbi:hypothetical protein E2542_SST08692 [Spatholobus suberectus]|nr:hypothetical protein E2542_SST08692 [Spatholobus suberectus]
MGQDLLRDGPEKGVPSLSFQSLYPTCSFSERKLPNVAAREKPSRFPSLDDNALMGVNRMKTGDNVRMVEEIRA